MVVASRNRDLLYPEPSPRHALLPLSKAEQLADYHLQVLQRVHPQQAFRWETTQK